MSIALVTGSAGLIVSESVRFFANLGFNVVGIDNDMRASFFGKSASTTWLEAVQLCEKVAEKTLQSSYKEENRSGDHI